MRICLVAPPEDSGQEVVRTHEQLAELLRRRHEVKTIAPVPLRPDLERTVFAGQDHRLSAVTMEAIEDAYPEQGPDYVEVADRHARGLVPLMARRSANPLFARTLFAVRLQGSAELQDLHDGAPGDTASRLTADLEREQLRLADRLIWPGGDTADLYRRFYAGTLPEAVPIGLPGPPPGDPPSPRSGGRGDPLRVLYAGDLRRGAGALDLAEACLRLPGDEWRLTMIGGDTKTGPAGQSVVLTIEEMFGGDSRLTIETRPAGEQLRPRFAEHDLLVVPPTFAVWPEAALEAMGEGLPILATPVGGLPEIVEDGVTGWLADGAGPEAIGRSLLRLLEDREAVERVRASGAIQERLRGLVDPERVLANYEQLLDSARPAKKPARVAKRVSVPLVTGVIPYYRSSAFVEEAVRSLLDQSHRRIEVVIINDGSFEPADAVLDRIAADPRVRVVTQLNQGEASARNLGARLARGEYVVMLDPDNVLEPQFVTRALEVFAREPDLAYVSCWLRSIGPDGSPVSDPAGYAALGNGVVKEDVENWDGDTLALYPRRLFAEDGLGFDPATVIYSDWELYRVLRDSGKLGTVIPERLARYRVLPSSLMRSHGIEIQGYGWNEARGRRLLRSTRWTAQA